MRLLHTSDWHVGKAIRGQSRAGEHRAVLAEIVGIVASEAVDVVLVVGDLFESAAPAPEAEAIVYHALLDLADTGAAVAVVAGNHDNPRRLDAVAPLLDRGRVHVLAAPARPEEGGLVRLRARSGGELALARLPFVSQRGVVRAEDLMQRGADERSGRYADRVRSVLAALCGGFGGDSVNVVATHLFVDGGTLGGGERSGHTVFDYAVPASAFPPDAHYVALGHLHRSQQLPGPTHVRYCGSPLQLDFGEQDDPKSVSLVEAEPGVPAKVTTVALSAGCRLRTLAGTLEELEALQDGTGEDWLRVRVHDQATPGLGDQVREWFPRAVEVTLVRPGGPDDGDQAGARGASRLGQSPVELFGAYLADEGVAPEELVPLFGGLLAEVEGGEP